MATSMVFIPMKETIKVFAELNKNITHRL